MLNWLELINCQSHLNSYVRFSSGSTCIVGSNNAGKTTILRALYCLVFNPLGYYPKLNRHGKLPIIRAKWNGHIIERNSSGYVLDGKPYKALKGTVPKDIARIFNLDELNFKMIREELFLISMPPGQRAKLINRASGLDSREELINICKKEIKNCTDDIKIKAHLRTSLQSTISRLTPILTIEEDIEDLDANFEKIEAIESEFEYISSRVSRLEIIEEALEENKLLDRLSKLTQETKELIEKSEKKQNEMLYIGYTSSKLEEVNIIMENEGTLGQLRDLLQQSEERNRELLKKAEEYEELENRVDRLELLEEELLERIEKLRNAVQGLAEIKEELGLCPLCGEKFKE
jgi:DNA repair exonuclease SbcCD ATPase subunit